jgi:hypothetical protein
MTTLLLLINLLVATFEGVPATSTSTTTTVTTTDNGCEFVIVHETGM